VIQKLKGQAFEDAPRALIFVKDKKEALKLAEEFKVYTKRTDLRVYCVYDEYDIDAQRDDLYDGTDIVIATPKRLNKVFYMNGIDLNKLQLFIVEDAEFLFRGSGFAEARRVTESIKRCQYLVFGNKYDKRFDRWREDFMYNAQIVNADS
jgi:superfamily II DNA/RNA helicase